ncbi:hypothetical protein QTN47_00960 [Danxiaibacter flavus]|uniref:Uncharacterized protein n=1 Tax=Danxiaibacter flavus TaxID=3049108 RepID=A0ABV3Z988_9BACT|nr:hypothetical protein QNM32_00960 [Chitinophagaceae bacterium DXS]
MTAIFILSWLLLSYIYTSRASNAQLLQENCNGESANSSDSNYGNFLFHESLFPIKTTLR